ncbi:MAG TPA: nitronate monooxygenase, partial [Dehalococcoidia bacterium]|nr:nitronate monooxygenase [Dehalococcoidia bacterium]
MAAAFRLMVVTPPGLIDPSLAIAASRAGALGVLNLEGAGNGQVALDAVERLARFARNDFGVRIGSDGDGLLEPLLSPLPDGLRLAVLAFSGRNRLRQQIDLLHGRGVTAIVEATSEEEALAGLEAGCDAVIAKGHEAGGRVGDEGAFVLLQRLLGRLKCPVWAQGGIGLHTVAACYAAGAAGAVLDSQVLLARESPLSESVKARIAAVDSSDTVVLGVSMAEPCRVYAQPGTPVVNELRQLEEELSHSGRADAEKRAEWRRQLRARIGWASPEENVLLLGQDAAFAGPLAQRFGTVGGILEALRQSIEEHCQIARALCPLDEGAPLAQSHGTRYPIVQGPMTRV